jgi:hypothetical protein
MTEDLIHHLEPVRRARNARRVTVGKLTGQKPALKMKDVWSIRARLELRRDVRQLALFDMAIDSKLRGCDLVRLRSATWQRGAKSNPALSSCRKRPDGPCSSRSRIRPDAP